MALAVGRKRAVQTAPIFLDYAAELCVRAISLASSREEKDGINFGTRF